MQQKSKIQVSEPCLPPYDEYIDLIKKLWENKQITNNGLMHKKLEERLTTYRSDRHCSLIVNGTLALIIGIKALKLEGEVITSPYSFIASTQAISWNGLKPVFCDIKKEDCTIDAEKIKESITSNTSAILPIHVYGNPCDIKWIQDIAEDHHLRVIYDAAHAFNTNLKGQSILNSGDISAVSFHATKIFNTIEGGAIFTSDITIKEKIDSMRNFGFMNNETIKDLGINGKMNEFQAAFGLLNLRDNMNEVKKRKQIGKIYNEEFYQMNGILPLKIQKDVETGYPYYPIFIDKKKTNISRDYIANVLIKNNIFPKKYFYPIISEFPIYNKIPSASIKNLPNAYKQSNNVLCLPIHGNMTMDQVEFITKIIKEELH